MLIRNKFSGYAADGTRVYKFGGGGGSSAPQTTTTTAELPEWARGYAQETLAKGQALSSQPYQTYGAERIAGFSPLQLQAQQSIAGLTPSQQVAEASDIASLAGAKAFQAGQYQPGRYTGGTFTPGAAGFYMSPFIEQAMAPQLREAQRSSDILGTQQAGQAVQAGAFGGSRAGLLEAERQRNLATQMGDIRARGYQTAYEQAANQFNQDMQRRMQAQQLGEQSRQFGAGLGLQGLGTALQAAGQLGGLGQTQFGQQQSILGLQRQAGAEQQALRQQGLSQAYQDFLNEQNYPYRQLGFMSDLIRGLPLGQQSAQQIYAAQPSPLQTIGSLGLGAYGMKQLGMFAEGGSVTDDRFVESALDKMSDMQLAQAEQAAIMRNDTKRIAQIAEEKATRASERRGLAGAFNQIPPDQRESMTQMARGGILAFAIGGDKGKEYYDDARGTESDAIDAPALFSPGYYLRSISEAPKPRTQEEIQQAATQRAASLGELYGKSALTPFAADIAKEREALTGQKEQNKGLVALAAAQALSRAPGLRAGLGEMFGAIGTESARLNKELQSSQRLLRQSEMELARADQARKDGQVGLAIQLENQADRDKTAAFERERAAKLNMAKLAQSAVTERGRTQLQKELAQQRIDATLEAARISAGRPGETVLAMREATAAFEAQGMNSADAKTKAVEAVLGRGSVTDWSRLTESYVQRELAKDPTIKDDPVRLAEVRALAGDKAATTLKGYGVKEAMGLEKALLEDEELKSLRLRRSGISNTPANADRLRSINESIKRREDEIRSGFTSSAPPSTPPAARPVAVRSATESVMSDTEKAEAREWLRKNPNDPRAARVRAALGE